MIFKKSTFATDYWDCIYTIRWLEDNYFKQYTMMILDSTKREYTAPSLKVLNVACEEGFKGSTGDVTFGDGVSDGWYGWY